MKTNFQVQAYIRIRSTASNVASLVVLLASSGVLAPHSLGQTVFPSETGETLIISLQGAYTPSSVQTIDAAQDLLFGTIDQSSNGTVDGVYGVYTGFFVPLDGDPSSDPSDDVNNFPDQQTIGINVEHTWPQSKGAGSGAPQANMHHLFPTKLNVNFARASFPFGEIADGQTSVWYRDVSSTTSIPPQDIDEYSELLSGQYFEPREDHKGNVARAMFYFYTIYRSSADAADPAFFPLQKSTLRAWHDADPVDGNELARNTAVAGYQSGKTNPFIDDETLVYRAYFADELPVELVQYSATSNGSTIISEWTTLSENDNSHFNIQLESPWHGIVSTADITGSGLNDGSAYSHQFDNVQSGQYTVVLRQIDRSGRVLEIGRRLVTVELVGSTKPYPNPARLHVSIQVNRPQSRDQVAASVFDLLGRRLRSGVETSDLGSLMEYKFDLRDAPAGVYFLVISSPNSTASKSFLHID